MITNKGLAERTIGLILIGLIVLVILAYWVYKTSRPESLSFQVCNALWVQWCLKCKSLSADCNNWDAISTPADVMNCTDTVEKGLGVTLIDDNCQNSRPDCLAYFDATGTLSCT